MPAAFYNGTTGILPVDDVIKKLLKTGYSHHIERLMILGNFLVLCEIRPNAVYQWFMELYVDAYDWVMVPNVYGMSQYADGGVMSTKPYISGSNYVMKMSNYPKGDWQIIWDALFWRFLNVHRVFFLKNPRMGMLVKTFDKMSEDKQNQIMSTADAFLEKLHSKK
jgi:deoxyribodipyrimidine photolyase-related protein